MHWQPVLAEEEKTEQPLERIEPAALGARLCIAAALESRRGPGHRETLCVVIGHLAKAVGETGAAFAAARMRPGSLDQNEQLGMLPAAVKLEVVTPVPVGVKLVW